MISSIFNFLTGYYEIRIQGVSLERVLNSAFNHFDMWDVKRTSYTVMYAKVSARGYKKLLKAMGDRAPEIEILKTFGLFGFFKRMYSKKTLFFGGLIMLAVFFAVNQFVWNVEITGLEELKPQVIMDYLNSNNSNTGSAKILIDLEKITGELQQNKDIAYASVGIFGNTLKVQIIEARLKDDDSPRNIIASEDAIIKNNFVYKGVKAVSEGDIVKKGSLLISGMVLNAQGNVETVKATGDVVGFVYRTGTGALPVQTEEIVLTGNTITQGYLVFGDHELKVSGVDNTYKNYVVDKKEDIIGGQQSMIPVKVITKTYKEATVSKQNMEMEMLMESVKRLAFENATKITPKDGKIVDQTNEFRVENDLLICETILKIEKNIGVPVKIK